MSLHSFKSLTDCPKCKHATDSTDVALAAHPESKCEHLKFHRKCLPLCTDCSWDQPMAICRGQHSTVVLTSPLCGRDAACLLCVYHTADEPTTMTIRTSCGHSLRAFVHSKCIPECSVCARKRCTFAICRGVGREPMTVFHSLFVTKTADKHMVLYI